MTVEQANTIDAIGTDMATGAVHLTVTDHLEWDQEHMLKLQEKLNAYLAFVESGEIHSTYPDAVGRKIVVDLILKYRPTEVASAFLEKIRPIIEQAGFGFHYGPIPTGYSNDNG
jgi:hypothetical protein